MINLKTTERIVGYIPKGTKAKLTKKYKKPISQIIEMLLLKDLQK
jgi:hypothetical protein